MSIADCNADASIVPLEITVVYGSRAAGAVSYGSKEICKYSASTGNYFGGVISTGVIENISNATKQQVSATYGLANAYVSAWIKI
jgi:hypothetical protein